MATSGARGSSECTWLTVASSTKLSSLQKIAWKTVQKVVLRFFVIFLVQRISSLINSSSKDTPLKQTNSLGCAVVEFLHSLIK